MSVLTSLTGVYWMRTNQMSASGNVVVVRTSDGARLTTDFLEYDPAKNQVTTDPSLRGGQGRPAHRGRPRLHVRPRLHQLHGAGRAGHRRAPRDAGTSDMRLPRRTRPRPRGRTRPGAAAARAPSRSRATATCRSTRATGSATWCKRPGAAGVYRDLRRRRDVGALHQPAHDDHVLRLGRLVSGARPPVPGGARALPGHGLRAGRGPRDLPSAAGAALRRGARLHQEPAQRVRPARAQPRLLPHGADDPGHAGAVRDRPAHDPLPFGAARQHASAPPPSTPRRSSSWRTGPTCAATTRCGAAAT